MSIFFITIRIDSYEQAFEQIIKPSLNRLAYQFKKLETNTRNSLIKIKVKVPDFENHVRIYEFSEKELETTLECDNCGCVFAIYGVNLHAPPPRSWHYTRAKETISCNWPVSNFCHNTKDY